MWSCKIDLSLPCGKWKCVAAMWPMSKLCIWSSLQRGVFFFLINTNSDFTWWTSIWNSVCWWEGAGDFDVLFTSDRKELQRACWSPYAAVSRFYVLWSPLPHTEGKSGMGKINRKAQNFTITCRVQACILWITVLMQKLKSIVIFLYKQQLHIQSIVYIIDSLLLHVLLLTHLGALPVFKT